MTNRLQWQPNVVHEARAAPEFASFAMAAGPLLALSPRGDAFKTEIIPLDKSSIVTNHLIARAFESDPTNEYRKHELTTLQREKRGYERLAEWAPTDDPQTAVSHALEVLRDKGADSQKRPLALGNRAAIDSMIAMHSVIFNPIEASSSSAAAPHSPEDLTATISKDRSRRKNRSLNSRFPRIPS